MLQSKQQMREEIVIGRRSLRRQDAQRQVPMKVHITNVFHLHAQEARYFVHFSRKIFSQQPEGDFS